MHEDSSGADSTSYNQIPNHITHYLEAARIKLYERMAMPNELK